MIASFRWNFGCELRPTVRMLCQLKRRSRAASRLSPQLPHFTFKTCGTCTNTGDIHRIGTVFALASTDRTSLSSLSVGNPTGKRKQHFLLRGKMQRPARISKFGRAVRRKIQGSGRSWKLIPGLLGRCKVRLKSEFRRRLNSGRSSQTMSRNYPAACRGIGLRQKVEGYAGG